ncbi:MAG: hypothetical protein P1U42_10325 [Phycisphaerales bacterium]|nr:hypothetical protein [Phycisphaerales bacterium]
MKLLSAISVSLFVTSGACAGIFDDFEGYSPGGLPGGVWQDAVNFIDSPTHPGDSISVIQTADAFGNQTNAVQIADHVGTSGGMMAAVNPANIQRFEIDVRLDQQGNGSAPNWMSATGFFQDTDQTDFNWGPQAVVYASGNGRFRLFVQNNDGRGSGSRDFGMGAGQWSLDTWYRVSLEVDTENGIFDASVTDITSGELLSSTHRTYTGWNSEFGQYDLVSVNDGEYGTSSGTIGNMSSYDNANYVPTPSSIMILGAGALLTNRRRRVSVK